MKHTKHLSGLILLLIFLYSCTTYLQTYQVAPITREAGSAVFIIKPISESEMYTLIDRNINPYVKYPTRATRNYIYVIQLSASSQSDTLLIDYTEISLAIENHKSNALESYEMMNVWAPYVDSFEKSQFRRKLDQTLLPKEIVLAPGQNVSGYMVFFGPYPAYGNAILSIPAQTPEGDTGTLSFEYTIYAEGEDPKENTGIFAEN